MSLIKNKFVGSGEIVVDSIADSDATHAPSRHAVFDALGLKLDASQKGAASGVCPLDGDSKVSSTYLPSYVDDIVEYANLAAFPETGVSGIIYVALDTNKIYRWSGSTYVEVSPTVNYLASSISDGDTTHAPDGNSVFDALAGKSDTGHDHSGVYLPVASQAADSAGLEGHAASYFATSGHNHSGVYMPVFAFNKESLTLSSQDITNQYKDCAQLIIANSLDLFIDGVNMVEGVDYSLSTEGGKTRITFLGILATGGAAALVANDVLRVKYAY